MRKRFLTYVCSAAFVMSAALGAAFLSTPAYASASEAISLDFSTTTGTFSAPANFYGWTAQDGVLKPDYTTEPTATANRLGYLTDKIALNEAKYISLEFCTSATPFSISLVKAADEFNPWSANTVGFHTNQNGWLSLYDNIDLGRTWIADFTGLGSCADGGVHKLEITSDGTNLTYTVDGVAAFSSIAIPANEVYLVLQTGTANAYVDNLYIGDSKPVTEIDYLSLDFETASQSANFTAFGGSTGWTVSDGKFVANAAWASANTVNKIDLTKVSKISFNARLDPDDTVKQLNVGLFADLATAPNVGSGINVSIGSTFWVGSQFGRQGWIQDTGLDLYDGEVHAIVIEIAEGAVTVSVDGEQKLAPEATATEGLIADQAYLLVQATSTATYIDNLVIGEKLPEYDLDFEETTDGDGFVAFGSSAGWKVEDGKYLPNAGWASVNTANKIALNEEKQISFDVYLDPDDAMGVNKQFNFGFFADLANVGVGAGKNLSLGATLWMGSQFGRQGWIADTGVDLYDGNVHAVKLVVNNGMIAVSVDGTSYDMLTTEIPADETYLLMQATSAATYIDNFYVGPVKQEAPPVIEPPVIPDEINLTFKKSDENSFTTLGNGGWMVDDGLFYPAWIAWASSYLTQPVPMDGEKYISFDVYAAKDNSDASQTQFNAVLMTDLTTYVTTAGAHFFMNGTEPVFSINQSFNKGTATGEIPFNWNDGKVHNIKIAIKDGAVTFALDGETVVDAYDEVVTINLSDTEKAATTYLVFQATNFMTCIDNLVISNTDIEYVAPETETLTFDGVSHDYSDAAVEEEYAKTAASGNTWAVNADGKFTAASGWSVAYLKEKMNLTDEKTITLNFCLTDGGAGDTAHQFLVGLSKTTDSYAGLYLTCYQGVARLNYWLGPTSREIGAVSTNYFDGQEHTLKFIIDGGVAALTIDDVVLFKEIQVGMSSGYFKVQSSNTTDWIDNLEIKNVADPISVPDPDGDIATKPSEPNQGTTNTPKGDTQTNGVWLTVTIVCAVVAVLAAAGTVFVFIKKNPNDKSEEE